MGVTFSPTTPRPSINCGICLCPLKQNVVCHDNMHFLHKKCMDAWANHHPSCPICRAPLFDRATFYFACFEGLASGLMANLLILNQNPHSVLSGPVGAIMTVAIGKLMRNSWASSNAKAITLSTITFVAPLATTYFTTHYL